MSGMDLLRSMGQVDASIVAEAGGLDQIRRVKKIRKMKTLVAAAVLAVCVLTGGVVVAAAVLGIGIFHISFNGQESGYDLKFQIERMPQEAFTGEVNGVREIIRQQYADYNPFSSWYPGSWVRDFQDWESAIAFLGVDFLENPLPGKQPKSVHLDVMGTQDGDIVQLLLTGDYEDGPYGMSVWVYIYTDRSGEALEERSGMRATEDLGFATSEYTTENGLRCLVVESSPLASGYVTSDAYMVKGGMLYAVHVRALESESAGMVEWLGRQIEEIAGS